MSPFFQFSSFRVPDQMIRLLAIAQKYAYIQTLGHFPFHIKYMLWFTAHSSAHWKDFPCLQSFAECGCNAISSHLQLIHTPSHLSRNYIQSFLFLVYGIPICPESWGEKQECNPGGRHGGLGNLFLEFLVPSGPAQFGPGCTMPNL